jgi:7,8-dihydropterin-6-yl-methyl-4-(beta-D-ribofuranosyl)aminobenzene 5'-phosphate synthase
MIKISVLLENTKVSSAFKASHGLSIGIDAGDSHLLLDVGPNNFYALNAQKMGYDISQVSTLILSHSHYDHVGGLSHFVKHNTSASVLLHDSPFNSYYSKTKYPSSSFFSEPIGFTCSKKVKSRISSFSHSYKISDNVWCIPVVCNNYPKPEINKTLYKKEMGKLVLDDFAHESVLVIEDEGELVVFNSCSHNGVINSIESVKEFFPDTKIRSYVGGFHYHSSKSDEPYEKMDEFCQYIQDSGIMLYTGHCTGAENISYLQSKLGNQLQAISTGQELFI